MSSFARLKDCYHLFKQYDLLTQEIRAVMDGQSSPVNHDFWSTYELLAARRQWYQEEGIAAIRSTLDTFVYEHGVKNIDVFKASILSEV